MINEITYRLTCRQTDMHTGNHADRHADRHAHRAVMQIGKQTDSHGNQAAQAIAIACM